MENHRAEGRPKVKLIAAVLTLALLGACGGSTKKAEPETKIVTFVPEVCLDAIDAARDMFQTTIDFMEIAQTWPDMTSDALGIGYTQDMYAMRGLLSRMKRGNARLDAVVANADSIDFAGPAQECEAEAADA